MILTSKVNNKALSNLNGKLLEILNNRGILASYLKSPLSKTTNPEHSKNFKLVKVPDSNRVIDLLINETLPVTIYKKIVNIPW